MPFTVLTARPTAGETSQGTGTSIVKLLADADGDLYSRKYDPERQEPF